SWYTRRHHKLPRIYDAVSCYSDRISVTINRNVTIRRTNHRAKARRGRNCLACDYFDGEKLHDSMTNDTDCSTSSHPYTDNTYTVYSDSCDTARRITWVYLAQT